MTKETLKEARSIGNEIEKLESVLDDFQRITKIVIYKAQDFNGDVACPYSHISKPLSDSIRKILEERKQELENQLEAL